MDFNNFTCLYVFILRSVMYECTILIINKLIYLETAMNAACQLFTYLLYT